MQMALLKSFEDAYSFKDAQTKITRLEKFDAWEPDDLKRLEQAGKKNRQIAGAWGVDEGIRRILEKFKPSTSAEVSIDDLPF
jgi:hypothetical protein